VGRGVGISTRILKQRQERTSIPSAAQGRDSFSIFPGMRQHFSCFLKERRCHGSERAEVLLLPFPTTNGRDLLKALSGVGSCTGRPQTGRFLPASVICVIALAQQDVLGGQGPGASCSQRVGSEVPAGTRWAITITSFGSKTKQPFQSELRSRKTCFQQWVPTVFNCSFCFVLFCFKWSWRGGACFARPV